MMGQLPTASWARPSFRPSTKAPTSSSVLNREKLTRQGALHLLFGQAHGFQHVAGLGLAAGRAGADVHHPLGQKVEHRLPPDLPGGEVQHIGQGVLGGVRDHPGQLGPVLAQQAC